MEQNHWLFRKVDARVHAHGKSISALARKMGLSRPTLSGMLKSPERLRAEITEKLMEELGVPFDWLRSEGIEDALVNIESMNTDDWEDRAEDTDG